MKRLITLIIGLILWAGSSWGQTILISPTGNGGFESGSTPAANSWTAVNSTVDSWVVGNTPTPSAGSNCGYISADGGTSWTYSQVSVIQHIYYDVTIPAGEPILTLTFKWKAGGEGSSTSDWDNMKVFFGLTSAITPVANSAISSTYQKSGAGAVSGMYKLSSASWNSETISMSGVPGSTYRLVFSWKSDVTDIVNPPAAIDEISLVSQVPGNYVSTQSGNWSSGSTWVGGNAPSTMDNVTIETGHTVTIDASNLGCNDLTVKGTLTYGTTPSSFAISGNMTVNSGGAVNVYQSTTGKTLNVAGNITNNGAIDLSVGSTTAGLLNLNGTTLQTISGAGVFTNGYIRNLTINNTSSATPNIDWQFDIKIAYNLTLTAARIQMTNYKMTWGNSATGNTLSVGTGSGFLPGAKYARWWTTGQTGTSISAGSDPTTTTSRYPFIDAAGQNRSMWIERSSSSTTGNTAGELAVVYTDGTGMTTGLSVADGAYTITDRYNGYWTVTAENGYVYVSGTHEPALLAPNSYLASNGNSRVIYVNSVVGTHQNGTTTPCAQRTGLTTAELTAGPLYMGINGNDIPFSSITSGNWESPGTWNKGAAPTASDNVFIATGHAVTVNSAAASANNLTVNSGGTLNVSGSTLGIAGTFTNNGTFSATGGGTNITGGSATGITNAATTGSFTVSGGTVTLGPSGGGNTRFTNNGTLTVSSTGTLNINGNLVTASGSSFNQSGGDINIDGNAAGVAANSVLSGNYLLSLNAAVNWTGGTLTIVDPSAAATSTYSLYYNSGTYIDVSSNHTLRFGDGSSSDAGGNAVGFFTYNWAGSGKINFGKLIINGPGTGSAESTSRMWSIATYTQGITGDLVINNNGEVRTGIGIILGGNLIVNSGGTLTHTGTFTFALPQGSSSVVNPNAQQITNNGTIRNLTTSPTANFSGLTVNNNNTSGLTLNSPLSISGTLTLTSGIINNITGSRAVNLLTLGTATAAGTLSGGSSTAYINGPFARTFPASRTATGTYSSATLFPVGNGTSYLPIWIDPSTTSGGAVLMTGEAFTTNPGTEGAGVSNLSANRWEALVNNGSGNFTGSFIRIGDAGINSSNQILQANNASGVYGSLPVSSSYAAGTPNTLTTGTQILAASYNGYFAYGDLTPCSAPTAQPTNLIASFVSSTGFTGTFTAAVPAPSHYLVVRYANPSTPTNPVDYTNYTVGATLGTGTVRMSGTATTFVETGLTAGVTYDYYVYSYNNSGCYGPVYLTTSPLFASVATCATAVGVPGTPTATSVTNVSFTASWTASSTSGVTYYLDVATDAAFTSFVTGYNFKNMGTNLSENVTGLTQNTPYYVRVRAFNGSTNCYSSYSGTLTQTTQAVVAVPWEEGFLTTSTPAGWNITGWTIGSTRGVTGNPGNNIYKNLYSSATTGTFTTVNVGNLPPNYMLSFDYILANWSPPYGPPASGSGNYVVSISTDFGATYTDLETVSNNGVAGWQAKQYDLSSYAGSVVKIKIVGNWTSGDYDLAFDNFKIFQQQVMTYSSSTTTQTNTGAVALGANDAQIIGIEIVTVNSLSPISATSFSMNTNGTDDPNDIAAANLYYTGTSGVFATTTAFGSTVSTPSGVFTFNGSQQLQSGTNYFWLAYDIAPGATSGNQVDAECTQITVAAQNYAPTVTAPAGSRTISAPLAGTKTVGSGGDFATLTGDGGLFETVNLLGLSGNLTATITASITTEPGTHALNAWPETGTGGYTLTIKPAASATPTVSGSLDNDALIRIIGANRVTIDGSNNGTDSRDLTISNTSITAPYVMFLGSVGTTPLADVTVKNTTLINGVKTATAVIISDEALGDPGYFDNILIDNNAIQQAFGGLFIVAAPGEGTNLTITGNQLNATGSSSIRWYGMYLEGVDNGVISGNEIGNLDPADSETDAGISLGSGCTSIDIFNNRIDNLGYTGTGGYGAHGIEVITGVTNADINIYNNLISNLTGDGWDFTSSLFGTDNPFGVLLGSTQSGINLYNNSIYLTGNTINRDNAMSAGIFVGTGTSASINNNIIVNNLGLLGATGYGSCGVYAQTANTQFTSINNNDYVVSPSGTGVKAIGKISTTTTALTLAEWQTATAQDAASISADPLFTDAILRLNAPYSPAIGKAAPLAKVTDDYSGNARHPLYPTIGAHEYAPVNGWIGNTSNWNLGSNWSFGTVPDDTYWVIIPTNPSGGSDPSIPSPVDAKCNGLTIENNASIEIQDGARLNVKNQ